MSAWAAFAAGCVAGFGVCLLIAGVLVVQACGGLHGFLLALMHDNVEVEL